MLRGSINHPAITVTDLGEAMRFLGPLLERLGYTPGEVLESTGTRLVVNINHSNGTAVNVWQAQGEGRDHPFEVYEPGLHHLAFNVAAHDDVDDIHELVRELGGEILDGPADFPYADDGQGYYAVYFLGPDRIKFECVHMPGLERAFRDKGVLE